MIISLSSHCILYLALNLDIIIQVQGQSIVLTRVDEDCDIEFLGVHYDFRENKLVTYAVFARLMMVGRSDAQLKANVKMMEFQKFESLLNALSLFEGSYNILMNIPKFLLNDANLQQTEIP